MKAANYKLFTTLLVGALGALIFYASVLGSRHAEQAIQTVRSEHSKVSKLFQASFYFFHDDVFVPGVKALLTSGSRLQIVKGQEVLFDSKGNKAEPINLKVQAAAEKPEWTVLKEGFKVQIVVPEPDQSFIYSFDGASVWLRYSAVSAGLLATLALGFVVLRRERLRQALDVWQRFSSRYWKLQPKLLFGIVVINLVAAASVYFSLVAMQTREQTERLEKESVLFTQFSTPEVVTDFTNYFYFYYSERFLPEIKKIISANENLLRLKLISHRNSQVLFDTEAGLQSLSSEEAKARLQEKRLASFSVELEEQLKVRDLALRRFEVNGDSVLTVVNTYRDETFKPIFWVQMDFGYQSLQKSIAAIRRQILLDFLPALLLGGILAYIFARLMLRPIRRLMAALQKVTSGDYDVTVEEKRTDEIGDLVGAFNTMTSELKKKKELRKYLSDSTYRQIMEAPEGEGGIKIGGTRVFATVLFCDIRNFVRHCENMGAEDITAMLNEYFSEMVEVVYKHGGEVDKFIGDAFLAVFYAADEIKTIRPAEDTQDIRKSSQSSGTSTALQAIYCGMEMRGRLADFNKKRKIANKEAIEIGVGISYGEIISGPIGAKDRMDFTVIGDVVNLASRIEKISKRGSHTRIVFSNHVEEKIRGLLDYHELAVEKIRGKEEEVHVFELIGIRDLKVLIEHLKSEDRDLKRRSVDLLGLSRNAEALDAVIAVLKEAKKDKDEALLIACMVAIGKLAPQNNDKALDALFAVTQYDVAERVVSAAIATIGRFCTNERVFELLPFLESEHDRIVANTVEAIGQVRDAKATDKILPLLNSRNNRVKANAAMAVFAGGRFEVIDTLKPMLMHSEPLMRSSAAFAIGELTSIASKHQFVEQWKSDPAKVKMFLAEIQECVPMLVSLLRDVDPMVKRQAVLALGKIKDKTAVLPIIEMIDPTTVASKELLEDVAQALRSIGSHSLVREVISKLSSK